MCTIMNSEDIWISIIMPLILGPLFVFLKTLWDRSLEKKNRLKKLQFDENVNNLKEELTLFYYPLYLNLLNLYGLCFSIPVENNCDEEEMYSSSDSELSDGEEHGHKHYRKRRCKAYYKKNNKIETCRNVIPHNVDSKMCRTCRWKLVRGDLEMGLLEESEIESEHENEVNEANQLNDEIANLLPQNKNKITKRNKRRRGSMFHQNIFSRNNHNFQYTEQNSIINGSESENENEQEYQQESYERDSERESINESHEDNNREEIRIIIPTITDQTTQNLDDFIVESLDLNLNLAKQFKHLSVTLTQPCIAAVEKTTEQYYVTISNIIGENIHRVEPDTRLMSHLIRFMKYAKIKSIIYEHNLHTQDNCKPENLGVEDNTVKLLTHIEACIKVKGKLLKQYLKDGDI